jgi:NADP-dependent 3-hydroxy acid dehydrogenase YdfG
MENLLNNKTAVVYGAGSIGSAVATAFTKAGATVFVAAHSEDALERFAHKNIQTEQVDVLDRDAVAAFVNSVVEKTGHVDISFCDKTLTSSTNPEMDKRFEGWGQRWASRNLLGKAPTLEEVGNMAVFMASNLAGATTGTTVSLNDGMINH